MDMNLSRTLPTRLATQHTFVTVLHPTILSMGRRPSGLLADWLTLDDGLDVILIQSLILQEGVGQRLVLCAVAPQDGPRPVVGLLHNGQKCRDVFHGTSAEHLPFLSMYSQNFKINNFFYAKTKQMLSLIHI